MIPAVLMAGTSYYVGYFVVDRPTYIAWFGDLVIGLASMQMAVLVAALMPRSVVAGPTETANLIPSGHQAAQGEQQVSGRAETVL